MRDTNLQPPTMMGKKGKKSAKKGSLVGTSAGGFFD